MSGKKLGLSDKYKGLNVNRNYLQYPVINSVKPKPTKPLKLKKGGGADMSEKQAALAAKAPPPNKLDGKDFAVLRAEKAKGRGKGLQDETLNPGKTVKASLGLLAMKKAKDKGAKGPELLSPIAMAGKFFTKGGKVKK